MLEKVAIKNGQSIETDNCKLPLHIFFHLQLQYLCTKLN
ncbi:hypothetical protein BROOK1789C_2112 [Bathymodiolus brooksi thiotrophic gill symbiont]|nr:hypothetical protein BROOK1789C_2112 [Bathymodiolus brooksi thiotrophic gill symbiont]